MKMPGFNAEASLYRNGESYHLYSIDIAYDTSSIVSASDIVVPARTGPVSDCACCIFLDKYNCCRDCVEAILNSF
jgi:hypothetical protein